MEILKPWSSSSETISTVPAFPSQRTTALPTSLASASWNARRIVDAQSLAAGISSSLSLPRSGFSLSPKEALAKILFLSHALLKEIQEYLSSHQSQELPSEGIRASCASGAP